MKVVQWGRIRCTRCTRSMHWRSKRERPASVAGVRGPKPCVVLCDDFWLLLGSGPNWAASAVVAHLMISVRQFETQHRFAEAVTTLVLHCRCCTDEPSL